MLTSGECSTSIVIGAACSMEVGDAENETVGGGSTGIDVPPSPGVLPSLPSEPASLSPPELVADVTVEVVDKDVAPSVASPVLDDVAPSESSAPSARYARSL